MMPMNSTPVLSKQHVRKIREIRSAFMRTRSATMKNISLYEAAFAELGNDEAPADYYLRSVCG